MEELTVFFPLRSLLLCSLREWLKGESRVAIGFRGDLGLLLTEVVKGSPAEEAGLEEGNIITHIQSLGDVQIFDVATPVDLGIVLDQVNSGDMLQVTVFRFGEERSLDVALESRPAQNPDGENVEGQVSATPTMSFTVPYWGFPHETDRKMNKLLQFVEEVTLTTDSRFRAGNWEREELSNGTVQYRIKIRGP